MAEAFDMVIRNARIVDGTENPYFLAHIALSQGRIVKIDRRVDPGGAKKIIDADIVIFDPEMVLDKATFDDPRQKPEGIVWVLINGQAA